ncbi:MAG: hypothetical protein HOV80_33025 [Polyangiaceae bacterium]|nr:hypothetical protein [Polyangiaceae bacterium]
MRKSLVLAALTTSVCLVAAPSVFADDPPDSHRPNDDMMQDRDPYDPSTPDQGQHGGTPGARPDAPTGEKATPYTIERKRTGVAESLSQSLGGGANYVNQFNWFMGRTLPLSPLLYPLDNEVSVEKWIQKCAASKDGWVTTTCYGGGWGGEREKAPAAVSALTPDAT